MDQNLTKIRHERSRKDFPNLKLENDEYVEFAITRAKICIPAIWIGAIITGILISFVFLVILFKQPNLDKMGHNFLSFILFAILAVIFVSALIATIVFHGNKLFITNKRVMQMVMTSPIASSINIIDLVSVEDASFHQNTIIQRIFKFGILRLSTIGDETTYTFPFSDISPDDLRKITKLISDAKKQPKEED